MPGLAGCISVVTSSGRKLPSAEQLAVLLVHEPADRVQTVFSDVGGSAVLVDPGLPGNLSGSVTDQATGVSAAYYGEFYNQELKGLQSGEHVARVLAEWSGKDPEGFADRLDGSFVILIFDRRADRFLLVNDHYASRPVFFTVQDDALFFAPELKGLVGLPDVQTSVNPVALVTFLAHGHLLDEQTFFEEIRPLQSASVLSVEANHVETRQYRTYTPDGSGRDLGESHYVSGLSDLLREAVRKRLHDTGETIIPLSGGIDSRGILGCVKELSDDKIRTVTWGVDESTEGGDAWVARQIAQDLGTKHTFLRRRAEHFTDDIEEMVSRTDGLTDDAALHHHEIRLMRQIRHELGGSHLLRGDECFGFGGRALSDAEAFARIGISQLAHHRNISGLLVAEHAEALENGSREVLDRIAGICVLEDYSDRKDCFYASQRLFHYLNRSSYYKLSVLNLQNPWLDRDILEFYQDVPWHYRIHKQLFIRTLETMYPTLMRFPIATSHSLEDWHMFLRNDAHMRGYVEQHLIMETNDMCRWIDKEQMVRFVSATLDGRQGRSLRNNSSIETLKKVGRQYMPRAYGRLKGRMANLVGREQIPGEVLTFRLLIMKLWFDQLEIIQSA